jgi:hypothetical protein
MRRRPRLSQSGMPPQHLQSFRFADWSAFAAMPHPSVDDCGSNPPDELRGVLRAFEAFADAQEAWRDEHDWWPVDPIDFIGDRVAQKLALVEGVRETRPGPALAAVLGVPGELQMGEQQRQISPSRRW